jgi:hypothetical protein
MIYDILTCELSTYVIIKFALCMRILQITAGPGYTRYAHMYTLHLQPNQPIIRFNKL